MSAEMVSEEAARAASPRHWIGLVVVYLLIPLVLLIWPLVSGDACGRNGDIPD
jgi:hypothetical protein